MGVILGRLTGAGGRPSSGQSALPGTVTIVTAVPAVTVDEFMLRAMDRWFGFWERRVPSLYRVIAVASGSLAAHWDWVR